MTAQHHEPEPPRMPGRSAHAIVAMLPSPEAEEFRQEWRAALARARDTMDLDEVTQLLERWQVRAAFLAHDPEGHRQAVARGRRAAAGEQLPGAISWDVLRSRLGV